MPNILKYFMKPKAEEYELPDTERMASQLEEMVRLKESIQQEKPDSTEPPVAVLPVFDAPEMQEQPDAGEEASASVSGEGQPAPAEHYTFAQAEADAIVRDAQEQAKRIIEEAKQAAESEVAKIQQHAAEEGYSQGYAEGRAKGEQEARESAQELSQRVLSSVQQFLAQAEQTRDAFIDQTRGELLDITLTIAEKVIRVSLKSSKEIIKRMIIAATDKLKRREWVQIYVSDSDIKGVAQADPTLTAALSGLSDHVKIVPMHDAEPGTCLVEMPDEIIDASAFTQLENIRAVIRENS